MFFEPFAPFGIGNPEPLFCFRGHLVDQFRILQEKHLSFSLDGGGRRISCIGFGLAEKATMLAEKVDPKRFAEVAPAIQSVRWPEEQDIEDLKKYLDLVIKSLHGIVSDEYRLREK